MEQQAKDIKLTKQQQKVLVSLFKFRFVSALSLSRVFGIRKDSMYRVLESLVRLGLVDKVFEREWRADRIPGYYFLNHAGVRKIQRLMEVKEPVVHALYKNREVSSEFVARCMDIASIFPRLEGYLPPGTDIFTKSEINRYNWFPKNKPDLYIRIPDNAEVFVVFAHGLYPYMSHKRIDEMVQHSEEDGWEGSYPRIAFVLKDEGVKQRFLRRMAIKLDNMGMEEHELMVLATTWKDLRSGGEEIWTSVYEPRKAVGLLG